MRVFFLENDSPTLNCILIADAMLLVIKLHRQTVDLNMHRL